MGKKKGFEARISAILNHVPSDDSMQSNDPSDVLPMGHVADISKVLGEREPVSSEIRTIHDAVVESWHLGKETGSVVTTPPKSTPSPQNSGGSGPHSPGYLGSYGGGGTYKQYAGKIYVVHKDGHLEGPWNVSKSDTDWWNAASEAYPPEDDRMLIPIDRVEFEYKTPRFNACTFTAAEDYVQARWGRKLHLTDKEWLASHPLATDDGIPTQHTAICLQALVEPYGLRISRIRVRKGTVVIQDTMAQFAQALGCNPFAMSDHATTNEEAIAKMGGAVDRAVAEQLWRFEFHDDPLPGSIIGERGWTNSTGVQTGAGGGHARYIPPRGKAGNWVISIQLAPSEIVSYDTDVPLPEYVPRRGDGTLLLGSVKDPEGKPVAVRRYGVYKTPAEVARLEAEDAARKSSSSSSSSPSTQSRGTNNSVKLSECAVCRKHKSPSSFEMGTEICFQCWWDAWKGYACPHCKTKFSAGKEPEFIDRDAKQGISSFRCPSTTCYKEFKVLDDKHKDDYPELVGLAVGLPDWVQEYEQTQKDEEKQEPQQAPFETGQKLPATTDEPPAASSTTPAAGSVTQADGELTGLVSDLPPEPEQAANDTTDIVLH